MLVLLTVACNDGDSGQDTNHDESMEMHDGNHEGHKVHQDDSIEDKDKTGPEYTSSYVCRMHCKGSGSDEPGKCPVCGMDYVNNENEG